MGAAILLALVMTYPVSVHPGSVGRTDSGDGRFAIWNVAWVARTLVADPHHLFEANIFYPYHHTLLFSEANLVAGALAVPAYWATRNPYAAHNSVFLLSFVLSALATYLLAKHLTRSRGAAAFAAVAFAYTPYVFSHTAHIQLELTAGIPLSLWAFHRLVDAPTVKRTIALGAILSVTALACGYYAIFTGLVIGFGALVYGITNGLWRRPRYWALLTLAVAVALVPLLPLFRIYLGLQERGGGMLRNLSEALEYSSTWRDYLTSSAWDHLWMLPFVKPWTEVLFPGFLPTVLAAVGAGFALVPLRASQAATVTPTDRRTARMHTIFYALVVLLAFWASLGPRAGLYRWLYEVLPIMSFLRAPSRFGVVVELGIAVLAAFAVARLLALTRSGRARALLSVTLPLVAALELAIVPAPAFPAREVPRADRMLADLPRGPVVELPFYPQPTALHHQTLYMLWSTYHWQPLINGYSDYIPAEFWRTALPISRFPTDEAFELLKARGARYVVVHLDLYTYLERTRVLDGLQGRYAPFVRKLGGDEHAVLYEIVAWPSG